MRIAFLLSLLIVFVYSHGAVTRPPARNTLNRNSNWMSANLGPKEGDWNDQTNICGAPDYINAGQPVASYRAGGVISITISTTAFHGGYYEFRLCNPGPTAMPPGDNRGLMNCIRSGPLLRRVNPLPRGQRANYKIMQAPEWTDEQLATRWRLDPQDGRADAPYTQAGPTGQSWTLDYIVPNVNCEHCVLHWYWQSLNSWQDGDAKSIATTTGERFWNCVDISIGGGNGNPTPRPVQQPVPVPVFQQPVPRPVFQAPVPVPVPRAVSGGCQCGGAGGRRDWDTYCSQFQAGQSFCALGVPGCICLNQASATETNGVSETSTTTTTTNTNTNTNSESKATTGSSSGDNSYAPLVGAVVALAVTATILVIVVVVLIVMVVNKSSERV